MMNRREHSMTPTGFCRPILLTQRCRSCYSTTAILLAGGVALYSDLETKMQSTN
jgi:hypothetical protein